MRWRFGNCRCIGTRRRVSRRKGTGGRIRQRRRPRKRIGRRWCNGGRRRVARNRREGRGQCWSQIIGINIALFFK